MRGWTGRGLVMREGRCRVDLGVDCPFDFEVLDLDLDVDTIQQRGNMSFPTNE